MHILLASDGFPPGSVGGAAWSTYALAQALQQHGYQVTVVVPTSTANAPELSSTDFNGFSVYRYVYHAPALPFVENYYRYERLWPQLAAFLVQVAQSIQQAEPAQPLVLHAQHAQTAPAAVLAGAQLGLPVIATVRDHWPWDYFATGLHGNQLPYPTTRIYQDRQPTARALAALSTDLVGRLGPLPGLLALPALPYMVTHVRRRTALLARADAVIAVSTYIRNRLSTLVPAQRLLIIPNMVDIPAVSQIAATSPTVDLPERFLLYVGKLEPNKGAALLAPIFRQLRQLDPMLTLPPLVIAGDGSLRAQLEQELAALAVPAKFLGWVTHDDILRLFARCELLLFPSTWGEPLSRVLLEASALGAPILAMPTGGTRDIISDNVNGMLAATPSIFATHLHILLLHPDERRRLGAAAQQVVEQQFAVPVVLPRLLDLYASLLPVYA